MLGLWEPQWYQMESLPIIQMSVINWTLTHDVYCSHIFLPKMLSNLDNRDIVVLMIPGSIPIILQTNFNVPFLVLCF